jgi:hypothetical protein
MLFELLSDLIWFALLYFVFYKVCELILREHAQLFKILFDIQVRTVSFSRESSVEDCHLSTHTIVSFFTFVLMAINPVIHSLIFVWLGFLDVLLLNRLVLTINLLKIIGWTYPSRPRVLGVSHFSDISQTVFVMVNYTNRFTLIPVLFQLLDTSFDAEKYIAQCEVVYNRIIGNENRLLGQIMSLHAVVIVYDKHIRIARLGCLSFLTLYCACYSGMSTWGEIMFFYYAALRIAFLYTL